MKTELKAKFLQHLSQKKQDQGFTLIELLVVIIIIGILSAIALPSFLNQANKAKQSEAKQYIGSMNRSQQAYFLENNAFATQEEFADLGLGVQTETTNYKYYIAASNPQDNATSIAQQNENNALKAYLGAVALGTVEGTGEATTIAILCEAKKAPVEEGPTPTSTTEITGTDPKCSDAGEYENLGGEEEEGGG